MDQAAAVIAIKEWLFICASPMSNDGIRIIGAITALDRQATPEVIGIAVREALAASSWVAPAATEESWRASYEPITIVTGFENIRDLMLAATMVTVDEKGEILALTLAEKPAKGNFLTLPMLEAMTPAGQRLIGDAVQRLLAAS
jgi:hypothetical protein